MTPHGVLTATLRPPLTIQGKGPAMGMKSIPEGEQS